MKKNFTKNQLHRLANIFDNASQIILASAIITPIISTVDSTDIYVVISGIIGVVVLWWLSLKFERLAE